MQKHTREYFKFFNIGFDPQSGWHDHIPCEIENCGKPAVDIHHIHGRGKNKDIPENLIALCRKHHEMTHKAELDKNDLILFHRHKLNRTNKDYSRQKLEGNF